jgi:dipeptidyl aminopeptidase/acylaminoacyl peptidase
MRFHPRAGLGVVPVLLIGLASLTASPAAEPVRVTGANYPLAMKFNRDFVRQLAREVSVAPQWLGQTEQFWYAVNTTQGPRYWRVDAEKKTKEPLFDTAKLAAALSELAKKPIDAASLEISRVEVNAEATKMKFVHGDAQFEYELATGKLTKLGRAPAAGTMSPEMMERMRQQLGEQQFREMQQRMEEMRRQRDQQQDQQQDQQRQDQQQDQQQQQQQQQTQQQGQRPGGMPFGYKAQSPDKKWYAYAHKHNLYLAEEGKEDQAIQLTTDGAEDYSFAVTGGFGQGNRRITSSADDARATAAATAAAERKSRPNVTWSPDSKSFYATRTDSRNIKDLFLVDSIANPRPILERYKYPMPGEEAVRKTELYYLDPATKKLVRVKPKWKDERYSNLQWNKSGDELRFMRRDRLQRNLEICSLNTKSGETKCLIVEGFDAAFLDAQPIRYVEETDEMIWWSERSGWGHFYLYGRDGTFKNAITSGSWRASRIVAVDPKNRLVYFQGNAREPGENVYYEHLYRVRFDGTDLTLLDPGNAFHRSYLSPSRRFVVDNASRTDLAPSAVLRNDKGEEVMKLEETDLTRLYAAGWKMPETFVVKAADGVTDLYGNMWKPFDFDPTKKYPIIANVYPGPQTEGVTHTFSAYSSNMQLAQLGFIVIQVGHRGGTPTRSKAYHSFGYFNLRDYGLVDKKAAIEELAARFPFIDLERVGIFGHSGGGFMSAAAVLQKPYNEFFKAAVASAGNHDNNIYNDNWSERYHGMKEVPDTGEKKEADTATSDSQGQRRRRFDRPEQMFEEELGEILDDPYLAEDQKVEELTRKLAELRKQLDGLRGDERQEKQTQTQKTEAAKSDQKKAEEKKTDDKKTETKVEATKDTKTETKAEAVKAGESAAKKEEPPAKDAAPATAKTRFDIKVPTNSELAANLRGHLLLVHGEIDNNVHPANTMRLVDALIKANKRFELLIIPGARHGFGPAQGYFTQRMWDFFSEHLLSDRQTKADIMEKDIKRK